MLCINNTFTDAYFNIAAEEHLLKNVRENVFMLYQNEPSVIIGKHQNINAEVNIDFAGRNDIKVVRRFSGGGSVFHDLGNLNLTFIENGNNLNFDKFTAMMIDMLAAFGIKASSDQRRALNIDGLKISGSAQCVYKNRTMYHATLLFSSDLGSLTTSLDANEDAIANTAGDRIYVKSVKSPVTNIAEHLERPVSIELFKTAIMDYVLNQENRNSIYKFGKQDMFLIGELKAGKYSTEEWNYYAQHPKDKNKSIITGSTYCLN